ncbi:glycosyltransferase family 4 protein [Cupriavidus basilensis]|uniref:glycosyltransferase family 4 protein n=1 Tax=Cupriavidus basilensis TaxID=68895 RepID=UPI00157B384D
MNATWRSNLHKVVIAKWLSILGSRIGAEKISYIPNAIDHKNFYLTQPISDRGPTVAMMYSGQRWKGAEEGIAALDRVKSVMPNLRAVLFGISARPKSLPLWIEYRENPTQAALRDEIYNRNSIYLCPSWSEGWGLPITEAMACGCAVISADNGGVHEFVEHYGSGLIARVRDVEALVSALHELLGDEGLRQRLAQEGMRAVKSFTYDRSLGQLDKLLVSSIETAQAR